MKEVLSEFDEIGKYETPTNFKYKKLLQDVQALIVALEKEFGLPFKIDDQIEDASFFCDINTPTELARDNQSNCNYSLRVSNFGRMTSLNFEENYSQATIQKIVANLDSNNFNYISSEILDMEYDGKFDKFYDILGGAKPTWRIRYFDYL